MVVLICFFPIVIGATTGLKSTPAELVELSRSLSSSTLQEFVRFRFPWSLRTCSSVSRWRSCSP